jgi:hypothetical protein
MPILTEQEQQEIIRYLEADKPLPDPLADLVMLTDGETVYLYIQRQGSRS